MKPNDKSKYITSTTTEFIDLTSLNKNTYPLTQMSKYNYTKNKIAN